MGNKLWTRRLGYISSNDKCNDLNCQIHLLNKIACIIIYVHSYTENNHISFELDHK